MKRGRLEGRPALQEFTVPEELALSHNEGRPIMEGIEGGLRSDPSADGLQDNLFVHGMSRIKYLKFAFSIRQENPLCNFSCRRHHGAAAARAISLHHPRGNYHSNVSSTLHLL